MWTWKNCGFSVSFQRYMLCTILRNRWETESKIITSKQMGFQVGSAKKIKCVTPDSSTVCPGKFKSVLWLCCGRALSLVCYSSACRHPVPRRSVLCVCPPKQLLHRNSRGFLLLFFFKFWMQFLFLCDESLEQFEWIWQNKLRLSSTSMWNWMC